jgi:hypothetical protein
MTITPSVAGDGHDLAGRLPSRVVEHTIPELCWVHRASISGYDCIALLEYTMSAPMRVGRIALARCRRFFSDREIGVLKSVERYRYLTARQIEALHFFDHASPMTAARTCRRTLERLTKATVLSRLERRIGGVRAGSASFIYTLSPLGHRLLHDEEGPRKRHREPSARFLTHTLAIAQFAIDVTSAARAGTIKSLHIEAEPDCWRAYSRGLAGSEILKPDLRVAFTLGEYEHRWFVEIDLASESTAAIVRKFRSYHSYWSSGTEQDRTGMFPRVLWAAPDLQRVARIERAIKHTPHLNPELFEVTMIDAAVSRVMEDSR